MPRPRGPAPSPSALKLLRGERRPSRVSPDEPQFESSLPDPPEHLEGEALAEWGRKVEGLHRAGVLTAMDASILADYCEAHAEVMRLIPLVRENGHTAEAANGGTIRNPDSVALLQFRKERRAAMVELGLTPSARTRVKALPKPKRNKFEDVG